ncbi:hypothetical protein COY28_06255 [Candidatus Woesearchaeota archaeon CG_4_10_14_0_2_um_filter_57_5]|nr:MAG: hypothetical protein COY28_06255 [Candidatus Woesearchaeota archaeon CG_4_10_14_0_2_um_filter_57_5]
MYVKVTNAMLVSVAIICTVARKRRVMLNGIRGQLQMCMSLILGNPSEYSIKRMYEYCTFGEKYRKIRNPLLGADRGLKAAV